MNDLYEHLGLLETIREAIKEPEKALKLIEDSIEKSLGQIELYEKEMWDGY